MKTVIAISITLILLSGCCGSKDGLTDAALRPKNNKDGYYHFLFCADLCCFEDKEGKAYEDIRIKVLESRLKDWCESNNCNPSDYEILYREIILPSWSNDSIFGRPSVVYDVRLKM